MDRAPINSFDNDDAADWVQLLEEVEDLTIIEWAIDRALVPDYEYLEASVARTAIAAADTVARLLGNWGHRGPETEYVDAWVEHVRLTPPRALVIRTHEALRRVLGPHSELLELWEASPRSADWMRAMVDLRGRVRTA